MSRGKPTFKKLYYAILLRWSWVRKIALDRCRKIAVNLLVILGFRFLQKTTTKVTSVQLTGASVKTKKVLLYWFQVQPVKRRDIDSGGPAASTSHNWREKINGRLSVFWPGHGRDENARPRIAPMQCHTLVPECLDWCTRKVCTIINISVLPCNGLPQMQHCKWLVNIRPQIDTRSFLSISWSLQYLPIRKPKTSHHAYELFYWIRTTSVRTIRP